MPRIFAWIYWLFRKQPRPAERVVDYRSAHVDPPEVTRGAIDEFTRRIGPPRKNGHGQ